MSTTLIVLAAGVGSRYGGLKQLEPVGPNGEALLEYSVFDALRSGFSKVVLVVREQTESAFRQAFEGGMDEVVAPRYVHQTLTNLPDGFEPPAARSKPWGTGQAILAAEGDLDGAFAVINADDFYGAESFQKLGDFLIKAGESDPARYAMVGFAVGHTLSDAGPVSRGICELDSRGQLRSIQEIPKLWSRGTGGFYHDLDGTEVSVEGSQLVSMNMWGFTPQVLPDLRREFRDFLELHGGEETSEFYIPEVVQRLVRARRAEVEILPHAGRWCGITYPEDRQQTARTISGLIEAGEYPEQLWG